MGERRPRFKRRTWGTPESGVEPPHSTCGKRCPPGPSISPALLATAWRLPDGSQGSQGRQAAAGRLGIKRRPVRGGEEARLRRRPLRGGDEQ